MEITDLSQEIMDVTEAALYLGTTKNSLYQHKDETLWPPYHRMGPKKVYWLKSELDQWIRLRTQMSKKDHYGKIYDKRSIIYKTSRTK